MKKIRFTQEIKAPAPKVYDTMLGISNLKTYEQWTAPFNPTSTYQGTWKKGGRMLFIGTDENGKKGGMVSEVADLVPNEFVSIRHIGILDGDKQITKGPDVEPWAGGLENYSFREQNGITTVTVECDTTEEFGEYFNNTWPKALDKLRALAEA